MNNSFSHSYNIIPILSHNINVLPFEEFFLATVAILNRVVLLCKNQKVCQTFAEVLEIT